MPEPKAPGMLGIPADDPGGSQQPNQGPPAQPAPANNEPGSPAPAAPDANKDAAPAKPGSPAQPATDPTKPAPDGGENKEPDQGTPEDRAAQYAKHFQTRHQQAMEYLNQHHPQVADEMRQALHSDSQSPSVQDHPGQLPAQPGGQQAPPAGQSHLTGQQLADRAPDPYEDPQGYATYVAKLSAEETRKMIESQRQHDQMTDLQRRYHQERQSVMQQIDQFNAASGDPNSPDHFSGVPEDVQREAWATVNKYKINLKTVGGPSAYFNAYVNEVDRIMSKRTTNQRQTELAGEAAAQAKQVLDMGQPSPAGNLTPGEKSPEQEHLEAMQQVGHKTFTDLSRPG